MAGKAFAEDRSIIEAQQRVIDATPEPRIMPTSADRAITLFNQMWQSVYAKKKGWRPRPAHDQGSRRRAIAVVR
jgi:vanillate O-demethylase monooxygenase subunit